MFKSINLSEKLDNYVKTLKILTEEAEIIKAKEEEKQIKLTDNLVNSQFEQAQKVIGSRLTMIKEHDTMFYFYIQGHIQIYRTYICSNRQESNEVWDFVIYLGGNSNLLLKLNQNLPSTIGRKDLSSTIIAWSQLVFTYELDLINQEIQEYKEE